MNATLKNTLCVFDLETTGLQVGKDRIVQIAALKIHPNGKQEELNLLVNPEMEIPQEVIDIHGISNEMAHEARTFSEQAEEIKAFFGETKVPNNNIMG